MLAEKAVNCTTPETRIYTPSHHQLSIRPSRTHPHMPHAPVHPTPPPPPPLLPSSNRPPFPILHSCQAATCSLQHAAQLLCYNDKLRSTVAGRSHYLLLLPWKTWRAISYRRCVPPPFMCKEGVRDTNRFNEKQEIRGSYSLGTHEPICCVSQCLCKSGVIDCAVLTSNITMKEYTFTTHSLLFKIKLFRIFIFYKSCICHSLEHLLFTFR